MFTYDGILNALEVGELDTYLAANDLDLIQLAAKDFALANLIGLALVEDAEAQRCDITRHYRNKHRNEAQTYLRAIQDYINDKK